jgi:hypothetical protein
MIPRKVILVLGKTGTGKSTIIKKLIERSPRTVIIDPMWEYDADVIVRSLEEFREYFNRKGVTQNFRIAYRKKNMIDYDAIFRSVWSLGNVLLVCEEADLIISARNKYFDQLVGQGRHRNVHLICIARRAPEVNKDFRAQVTSFFSFYQSEPDDIEHLREWGFSTEGLEMLSPKLEAPFDPKEGVNYLLLGEKLDEIEFREADYLTENSFMEE